MTTNRRRAERKIVDKIAVIDLTLVSDFSLVAKNGFLKDASEYGLLINVERKDLGSQEYQGNLDLTALIGEAVVLYLPQMNLDLDGVVTRAQHKGGGVFHIAIEFSTEVPAYWRQCLVELLPQPGEILDEAV